MARATPFLSRSVSPGKITFFRFCHTRRRQKAQSLPFSCTACSQGKYIHLSPISGPACQTDGCRLFARPDSKCHGYAGRNICSAFGHSLPQPAKPTCRRAGVSSWRTSSQQLPHHSSLSQLLPVTLVYLEGSWISVKGFL